MTMVYVTGYKTIIDSEIARQNKVTYIGEAMHGNSKAKLEWK